MGYIKISIDKRKGDPYVDRRSGEDRREIYLADYFENSGIERRSGKDRRHQGERRKGFIRVSRWSSIYLDETPTSISIIDYPSNEV